jgi:hypothetical protein
MTAAAPHRHIALETCSPASIGGAAPVIAAANVAAAAGCSWATCDLAIAHSNEVLTPGVQIEWPSMVALRAMSHARHRNAAHRQKPSRRDASIRLPVRDRGRRRAEEIIRLARGRQEVADGSNGQSFYATEMGTDAYACTATSWWTT